MTECELGEAAVSQEWRRLFKLIPGYDPIITAGDCVFDELAADLVIGFFAECLHHVEGSKAGQPFILEDWQKAHIGCAFGWKRADGTRRYREVFEYVPRKNGKTTTLAGLILFAMMCDGEPGAQVYSAAAEKEQASLVYRQARGMIQQEPELLQRCKIYTALKSITIEDTSSVYKALSAEAYSKHGLNAHFVVIDELHAQPNRDLVDVLITATASRRQPMVWHTTTADYVRESICNKKLEYAHKVRDGVIDDPFFLPVIYEASIDDDWTDPDVWAGVNPNLGVSVSMEYLERECKRAKEEPSFENTFKRLHCNIQTEQDLRWLQMHEWDLCPGLQPDMEGQECFAGLDLSQTTDLTALALYFPQSHCMKWWFWCPADNAHKRERRDGVPYMTWADQEYIDLTSGNVIDYGYVRQRINELSKQYKIKEIGYDPWNARQVALQLQDEDGLPMIEFRQGFISMNEPSKYLEGLVIQHKLNHGGNPVARWMASNVAAKTDPAGNIKPDKSKSTGRIDGIVAAIMAVGCSIATTQSPDFVYSNRGVFSV